MIALLLFAVLFHQKVDVPASRWRVIDLPVPSAEMLLEASFKTSGDSSRVAMILLTRDDALRFERGRGVRPLESTGWLHEGRLRYRFRESGAYALVIDNRIEGRKASPVEARVELTAPQSGSVRELPLQRRIVVIATSLLIFVAIVMYTARKFMR